MEEDDLDFTPTQSSSSNLASLFGLNKKPLQGNTSLTYTAPKPPKKESSPLKTQPTEEKKNKGVIIYSKAVQAYKLENRNYVNQGLAGIIISGNYDSSIYAVILYNHAKEHIANVTITKTFVLSIAANNYVSFYDNRKQNWSVMFQSTSDVEQFVEKVMISKFYCHPGPTENIMVQDLMPSSSVVSHSNSIVEISYSSFILSPQSGQKIKEDVKDKIDLSDSNSVLAKGLVGCSENTSRIIILPHSLCGAWSNELPTDKNLLLRVKIVKVISQVESALMNAKLTGDTIESPLDSSTEEGNVKTKTASMKDAIANTKSQKANLISRMARMGQATLPLKQVLTSGQSDSEEDCALTSSPKPRLSRNRSSGITAHQNTSSYTSQNSAQEAAKQLTVYQSDLSWQQMQLAKYGMPHQVVPVSASPVISPTTDPSFSVYVSESRMQASELRMNISKISDKVDAVLNKIQNLTINNAESKVHTSGVQDSSGILSGVQSLVAENEKLKANVEEQKKKLEQQNDRIFHLLELNQKYLEQNSTAIGKQSETELKLRKELEGFLEKDTQSREGNKKLREKISDLEDELKRREEEIKKLTSVNEKLIAESEAYKKLIEENGNMKSTVETYEEKLGKASEIVTKLKDKLRETMSENERLKHLLETERENMKTNRTEMEGALKSKNEEHEKTIRSLQTRLSEDESQHEMVIQDLNKTIKNLEEEKQKLLSDLQREKEKRDIEASESLVQLYNSLIKSFAEASEYSSSKILSIIEKCFKNDNPMSGELFIANKQTQEVSENITPTPVARSSVQNIEVVSECNSEDKKQENCDFLNSQTISKEEKKPIDDIFENDLPKNKKEEKYISNKSYDQRWRTTKPPPPPLFDDEDDDDWLN